MENSLFIANKFILKVLFVTRMVTLPKVKISKVVEKVTGLEMYDLKDRSPIFNL